ncbi:hypothetical protein NDU88_004268 [Pleurodeles waltl]|uniref:Uncharacterized protein n=1 Tax=Pleurodeles waltl TaxID=8319 RepID=A0AAV7V336_PLEWA|nr:hypothetical protein NDU88_004268 [Pleurodeles waltl]
MEITISTTEKKNMRNAGSSNPPPTLWWYINRTYPAFRLDYQAPEQKAGRTGGREGCEEWDKGHRARSNEDYR